MCKFIGKSNERVLCKLSKKEILRFYSIVHVTMETTKTSNFNRLSKSFISIFFTCQVSASELQPFSCYDLANDIYLQTANTFKLPKLCSATLSPRDVQPTILYSRRGLNFPVRWSSSKPNFIPSFFWLWREFQYNIEINRSLWSFPAVGLHDYPFPVWDGLLVYICVPRI